MLPEIKMKKTTKAVINVCHFLAQPVFYITTILNVLSIPLKLVASLYIAGLNKIIIHTQKNDELFLASREEAMKKVMAELSKFKADCECEDCQPKNNN